ncbi:MAG: hypothetical protein JNN07_03230 [Verrucomicrobiales bacterium]|nr:hypothetical protein [Verrucomicrobiales bacterium]
MSITNIPTASGFTRSRRSFLMRLGKQAMAAGVLSAPASSLLAAAPGSKRLQVAAIVTEYSYRSHAHVILENFLEPYLFNGKRTESGMDIVSLYVDQTPANELSRAISAQYKIPVYPTIHGALCQGGRQLAVDAVLSIGEHGKYRVNAKAQMEYPRKRFFDEIVAVFRASRRTVPVFSDKHLSYRWDWAKEMYDTSRRMGFPLMAGSSVPLAERTPTFELPPGARIQEAVSIHGGGVESYDIHALEVLQSMVEARRGGETGVARVQFLEGDKLWQAAREGRWSPQIAIAALASKPIPGLPTASKLFEPNAQAGGGRPFVSHGILIDYRDGTRGTMLAAGITGIRWYFGCQLAGESAPRGTSFYVGPWQNRNLFKALSHAIQTHFREKRSPYPVERTLMTTGILDAAMDSRIQGGVQLETPQLRFRYRPRDYRHLREMGASWKLITEDRPEPKGIDFAGE